MGMEDKKQIVRIVLADDHTIVREGLKALLEKQQDFKVVGQAEDGLQAVRLVRELEPDVLVLDLAMPSLHGLDVIAAVKRENHPCRILVLSMHWEQVMVRQVRDAGASGFLVKGAGIGELVERVRRIVVHGGGEERDFLVGLDGNGGGGGADRGSVDLGGGGCSRDSGSYLGGCGSGFGERGGSPVEANLTARELEVLRLVAEGYTTRQIAMILDISPKTADAHRQNLMSKLDIHDVAGLTRHALRLGLIGV